MRDASHVFSKWIAYTIETTSDTPHYEQVPFEVPSSWVWTTLHNITTIIGDGLHGTPQYDSCGDYYFINGNNLLEHKIRIKEDTKRVSEKEYLKYQKPLNETTILVSINGTIGNIGTYNGEKVVLGKSACYFNISSLLHKVYFCYLLESDYFLKYALNSATGSTIKNVPLKAINDFFAPLPPLAEQERIVLEIKRLFTFIEQIEQGKINLQTVIKQAKSKILDLAIHGKLVPQDPNDEPASELLKRINPAAEITCDNGQYGQLPKGWVAASISDFRIDILNGYAFQSSKYTNEGVRIIRITNVQDGYIEDDSPKYYPLSLILEYERFMLKSNDLLMSLTGNVGRVGFLPESMLPAALNQRVACIRSNIISTKFLSYLFRTNTFKNECVASAKGVAQLNISTEWLKEYIIMVPPLAEQHRIVAKIEELFSSLDNIQKALEV